MERTVLFDTQDSYDAVTEEYEELSKESGEKQTPPDWAWGDRVEMDWDWMLERLKIEVEGSLVIEANLGLWDGNRREWISTGRDVVSEVIDRMQFCGEYQKVYVEGDDLVISDSHHDGTNLYYIRRCTKFDEDGEPEETIGIGDIVRKELGLA